MAKIKKLLALGLCLCMAAGITVGCGNSKSSKNGTDSGKNTNDGLSFAFCTNTLNNTFQSSIDSKLKELCDKDGISYTCLDPDYDLNKQLSQLSDVANNGYDAVFVIPVDSAGITSGLVLQLLLRQQIKQAKLVYIVLMPHRMENRHYWMVNLQLLHVRYLYRLQIILLRKL